MIIADTHVHVYPFYNRESLLRNIFSNFRKALAQTKQIAPVDRLIFLTERSDCNFFRNLANGKSVLPAVTKLTVIHPTRLIKIDTDDAALYVVAGRQMVSAEKLELLGLGDDGRIEDGLSLRELVARASASSMVPVIPWSPGKWLGGRGRVLRSIIEECPDVVLSDSALRPRLFPEPGLFSLARKHRIPILCGTDPLPLPNEELRIGAFVSAWDEDLNSENPLRSVLAILRRQPRHLGKRLSLLGLGSRLWRLKQI